MVYIVMASILMVYIVMASIVMAYIVMADTVMASILMVYTVMACIVMAYLVMAYIVMAADTMRRSMSHDRLNGRDMRGGSGLVELDALINRSLDMREDLFITTFSGHADGARRGLARVGG